MSSTFKILFYGGYYLLNYRYIQPDEIGVRMVNGGNNGIADYSALQGHLPIDFNPATKGFVLPAQPWTMDLEDKILFSAQKGEWGINPQVTFRIDRSQAPLVCFRNNGLLDSYSKAGKEKFLESVGKHLLAPLVYDVYMEIIGTNSDSSLMNNTYRYQRMIEDSVKVRFKRVGWIVETFVSNLNPPASIIAKNRAKNESEAAAITAVADVVKAEAEAKVRIAEARSAAEAMLVTARANAEATKLQQQVLTPLFVQKLWIESWNGVLPTTITGGNTSLMMGIPK